MGWKRPALDVDGYDICGFIGLLMTGAGCYLITPWLSLIVVGTLLMAFAIFGSRPK